MKWFSFSSVRRHRSKKNRQSHIEISTGTPKNDESHGYPKIPTPENQIAAQGHANLRHSQNGVPVSSTGNDDHLITLHASSSSADLDVMPSKKKDEKDVGALPSSETPVLLAKDPLPTLGVQGATPRATDEASEGLSSAASRRRVHSHDYSVDPPLTSHELNHDLAAVGDQFAHTPADDASSESIIPALQRQFFHARIEWPEDSNQYFIPADDLRRLVTIDCIVDQLRISCPDKSEEELQSMTEKACQSSYKLFAILVCANKSGDFCRFLGQELDDKDLPFLKVIGADGKWNGNLRSSRYPDKLIRPMDNWGLYQVSNFSRDQWQMLSPIFKESDGVDHYTLLDNHVLPFIEDNERREVETGGFGSVWKVVIHPAHQFLYKSSNLKVCYSMNTTFPCQAKYARFQIPHWRSNA